MLSGHSWAGFYSPFTGETLPGVAACGEAIFCACCRCWAGIAQLAERQFCKLRVGGSSPSAGSSLLKSVFGGVSEALRELEAALARRLHECFSQPYGRALNYAIWCPF
jgi:hypothetical protein